MSINKKDFRWYLISLQRLKGTACDDNTPLEELSNLIQLKGKFSRFTDFIKKIRSIILAIITAIIGVIMKYLIDRMWITLVN